MVLQQQQKRRNYFGFAFQIACLLLTCLMPYFYFEKNDHILKNIEMIQEEENYSYNQCWVTYVICFMVLIC